MNSVAHPGMRLGFNQKKHISDEDILNAALTDIGKDLHATQFDIMDAAKELCSLSASMNKEKSPRLCKLCKQLHKISQEIEQVREDIL